MDASKINPPHTPKLTFGIDDIIWDYARQYRVWLG